MIVMIVDLLKRTALKGDLYSERVILITESKRKEELADSQSQHEKS
jgi:hypothetical protein